MRQASLTVARAILILAPSTLGQVAPQRNPERVGCYATLERCSRCADAAHAGREGRAANDVPPRGASDIPMRGRGAEVHPRVVERAAPPRHCHSILSSPRSSLSNPKPSPSRSRRTPAHRGNYAIAAGWPGWDVPRGNSPLLSRPPVVGQFVPMPIAPRACPTN